MKQWSVITRFAPLELLSRSGEPILGGYILQRISARSTQQTRQGIARIQREVRSDLLPVIAKYNRRLVRGRESEIRLGTIPEITSMAATQDKCEPIWVSRPETRLHFENAADKLLVRIRRMR